MRHSVCRAAFGTGEEVRPKLLCKVLGRTINREAQISDGRIMYKQTAIEMEKCQNLCVAQTDIHGDNMR